MENHVFIIILFFPKYTQPRSTDGKRTERGDSVLVFFFFNDTYDIRRRTLYYNTYAYNISPE